jgi:hypothetical protein
VSIPRLRGASNFSGKHGDRTMLALTDQVRMSDWGGHFVPPTVSLAQLAALISMLEERS